MLSDFNKLDHYRQHFMDPALWEPHVRTVYRRHFGEAKTVRPGLAGTYPTFIVDEQRVVKLFGRLFEGAAAFETEREAHRITAKAPLVPSPDLEAEGELLPGDPDWPWPYLVYEYIPGTSIGEIFERLEKSSKLEIARQMGRIVRAMHGLPLTGRPPFENSWGGYAQLIKKQIEGCTERQRAWAALPPHLIEQIDAYLLPPDELIDFSSPPHLIHADLTADHLLGLWTGRRWSTTGLIDWGDAMVGNLLYELVALQLDLFRGDREMLGAFLETYQPAQFFQDGFVRKAMCMTLLHRFNVLAGRDLEEVKTLEDLGEMLWGEG